MEQITYSCDNVYKVFVQKHRSAVQFLLLEVYCQVDFLMQYLVKKKKKNCAHSKKNIDMMNNVKVHSLE